MLSDGWDRERLEMAIAKPGAHRSILEYVSAAGGDDLRNGSTASRSLTDIVRFMRPMCTSTTVDFVHRLAEKRLLRMNTGGYFVTQSGYRYLDGGNPQASEN